MEAAQTERDRPSPWDQESWPHEVQFILSVLEQYAPFGTERRAQPRSPYRCEAGLKIEGRMVDIFTRDANSWNLGFIARQDLPVGHHALVYLPGDRAADRPISGTVLRCSAFIDGWYEGAVGFTEEQVAFRVDEPRLG